MIALTAQPSTIEQLDDLMVLVPLIMIVIALCLAFAVRIVFSWRGVSRMRGDDPYFFALGDTPTLTHQVSASALLRNESGGCPIKSRIDLDMVDAIPRSGTVAALTTFYMTSAEIPPADSNIHRRMFPVSLERDDG